VRINSLGTDERIAVRCGMTAHVHRT
jgi:hypothetical protein